MTSIPESPNRDAIGAKILQNCYSLRLRTEIRGGGKRKKWKKQEKEEQPIA